MRERKLTIKRLDKNYGINIKNDVIISFELNKNSIMKIIHRLKENRITNERFKRNRTT